MGKALFWDLGREFADHVRMLVDALRTVFAQNVPESPWPGLYFSRRDRFQGIQDSVGVLLTQSLADGGGQARNALAFPPPAR